MKLREIRKETILNAIKSTAAMLVDETDIVVIQELLVKINKYNNDLQKIMDKEEVKSPEVEVEAKEEVSTLGNEQDNVIEYLPIKLHDSVERLVILKDSWGGRKRNWYKLVLKEGFTIDTSKANLFDGSRKMDCTDNSIGYSNLKQLIKVASDVIIPM